MKNYFSLFYFLVIAFLIAACSDSDGEEVTVDTEALGKDGVSNSEIPAINLLVDDVMHSLYLWADETPTLSNEKLASYENPQDLVDAFKSEEDRFSFIIQSEPDNARIASSKDVGTGIIWGVSSGRIYVVHVLKGSPADLAGVTRGDVISEIDGATASLNTALALSERVLRSFDLKLTNLSGGDERSVSVASEILDVEYVSEHQVISWNGNKIGYLLFDAYEEASISALNDAFSEFKQENVRYLVLDLRYNGGGSVSVARHLASLIYGKGTTDDILLREIFNEEYSSENAVVTFSPQTQLGLDLDKLYVITGGGTASASELTIHNLRPYMDVITVGQTTYGKNVGSILIQEEGYDFFPISFRVTDVNGDGDYGDGIAPDISDARDWIDVPLGSVSESRLRAALEDISPNSAARVAEEKHQSVDVPVVGTQSLIDYNLKVNLTE
ncbi:S41 family peptidase [Limibacter armeniacum]|uniref:S41 family peptidase n=1 Tax=Limibacter armeniacum TaxID=466084 RepID=UPI002FE5BEC0